MTPPNNFTCPRSTTTLFVGAGEEPNKLRVELTILAPRNASVTHISVVFDEIAQFAETPAYRISDPRPSRHWEGSYDYTLELTEPIPAGEQRVVRYDITSSSQSTNEFRVGPTGRTIVRVVFSEPPSIIWQVDWADGESDVQVRPRQEATLHAIAGNPGSWYVELEAFEGGAVPGFMWE